MASRAHPTPTPPYTALSYAWGNECRLLPIQVGQESSSIIGVRNNLESFLRLQESIISYPTYFWVDAICINQALDDERTHQVQLMKRIYSRATNVYIWFGPAADDSDIAMEFVALRSTRPLRRKAQGYRPLWTCRTGKALANLCERPYWRRMWIVQEIIHAQRLKVWCGKKSFDWEAIESLYLNMKTLEDSHWSAHHEFVIRLLQSSAAVMVWQRAHWRHPDTPKPRLETLLEIFRDWKCTDIRDKVYALTGMASIQTAIVPDYSLSIEQIFHAVVGKAHYGDDFHTTFAQVLGISHRNLQLPNQGL
jgi:hypothetical protein